MININISRNPAMTLYGRTEAERLKNFKEYCISIDIDIEEFEKSENELMILHCNCGIKYCYPTISHVPLKSVRCSCGLLLIGVYIPSAGLFDDLPNKPLDKELLDETRELLKKG